LQQLTAQNAVPEIMSPSQRQAMETVRQLTASAQTRTSPLTLTPAQVRAINDVQNLAKTSVDKASLAPAQSQLLTQAEKTIADTNAPKPPELPPLMRQAVAQVNAVVQSANQPPPGMTADQAQAIATLSQAAAYVAPLATPPSITPAQALALQNVQAVAQGVDPSALSPSQKQAMDVVRSIAGAASSSAVPVPLSPAQVEAIARVQEVAVASTAVAATITPAAQVVAALNDPERTVQVTQGQFSGVAANQPGPTIPIKISPSQLQGMKSSSPLQQTSANPAIKSPGAAAAGLSPVPPGLDAKLVSASAREMQNRMGIAAAGTAVTQGPPPEGFFDPASGKMAPPSGGFVDLKTGLYIPPPPGSAFDPVAGVYVPPPTVGSFNAATGAYVPPAGLVLDATRGFIPVSEAKPAATSGFVPPAGTIDAFAKAAGLPTTAAGPTMMPPMMSPGGNPPMLGPAPGGMFPGMDPSMFGNMTAAAPPPGTAPLLPPPTSPLPPPPPPPDTTVGYVPPGSQYPVYDPQMCPPYCDPVAQPGSPTNNPPDPNLNTSVSFSFN
jgi:hypothetical protein